MEIISELDIEFPINRNKFANKCPTNPEIITIYPVATIFKTG